MVRFCSSELSFKFVNLIFSQKMIDFYICFFDMVVVFLRQNECFCHFR